MVIQIEQRLLDCLQDETLDAQNLWKKNRRRKEYAQNFIYHQDERNNIFHGKNVNCSVWHNSAVSARIRRSMGYDSGCDRVQ